MGASQRSSRTFFFTVSSASASSSYAGAITTSVKTSAIAAAIAAVSVRLTATTPPNADTGSQSNARP